jgi:hypothetical protein
MCDALGVFFPKLLSEILLNFVLKSEMSGIGEICLLLRFGFMQPCSEAFRLRKLRSPKPWYQNTRCHMLQDSNYHNLRNLYGSVHEVNIDF